MEVRYDPKYDIASIRSRASQEQVETIRLSDEILLDIAADGRIYGVELLNANEQLGLLAEPEIRVTDASTGETVRLPLKL